jgi:hypothetical protein
MSTESAVKEKEKLSITVVHNGVPFELDAPENASVQSVFSRAMEHFGTSGQANYALFTEQNAELNLQQSLRDAGVKEEQRLVLRAREVRAGAQRD